MPTARQFPAVQAFNGFLVLRADASSDEIKLDPSRKTHDAYGRPETPKAGVVDREALSQHGLPTHKMQAVAEPSSGCRAGSGIGRDLSGAAPSGNENRNYEKAKDGEFEHRSQMRSG